MNKLEKLLELKRQVFELEEEILTDFLEKIKEETNLDFELYEIHGDEEEKTYMYRAETERDYIYIEIPNNFLIEEIMVDVYVEEDIPLKEKIINIYLSFDKEEEEEEKDYKQLFYSLLNEMVEVVGKEETSIKMMELGFTAKEIEDYFE